MLLVRAIALTEGPRWWKRKGAGYRAPVPIACKPAVLAETDEYVAFGSEYRALVNLPAIDRARVWEPEPATVYFWEH